MYFFLFGKKNKQRKPFFKESFIISSLLTSTVCILVIISWLICMCCFLCDEVGQLHRVENSDFYYFKKHIASLLFICRVILMIAYYYIKCWHFIWLAYLTMSYLICPPTPTQTWFSAIINNFVMIIFVKKKSIANSKMWVKKH